MDYNNDPVAAGTKPSFWDTDAGDPRFSWTDVFHKTAFGFGGGSMVAAVFIGLSSRLGLGRSPLEGLLKIAPYPVIAGTLAGAGWGIVSEWQEAQGKGNYNYNATLSGSQIDMPGTAIGQLTNGTTLSHLSGTSVSPDSLGQMANNAITGFRRTLQQLV